LTGSDVTSKVGSKPTALKAFLELYLKDFGKSIDRNYIEPVIAKAECYLVKVLKHGTNCTTMEDLRYTLYHQSKVKDLTELPPTSAAIRMHILRCIYVCNMQMNCLNATKANPTEYGFEEKDGILLPCNIINPVPGDLVIVCNCKTCSSQRCLCRKAGVTCCIYCHCEGGKSEGCCKNPNVLASVSVAI